MFYFISVFVKKLMKKTKEIIFLQRRNFIGTERISEVDFDTEDINNLFGVSNLSTNSYLNSSLIVPEEQKLFYIL